MKLTDREKITLVKILVTCIIAAFALFYFANTVNAQNMGDDTMLEYIEDVEGAKSIMYYCDETDTYLIYSKKSGEWFNVADNRLTIE